MTSHDRIRRDLIIQHAEGYLALAMPEQALLELSRLERKVSADAHALYLRGEALRELEQWGEAARWLSEATELDSDNVHAWLALGWCLKRSGFLEQAIEALESALAADSTESIVHYNLACYWCLAGDKSRTLSYLAQALDMDDRLRDLVPHESDFDPLRNDPDFQDLTSVIV